MKVIHVLKKIEEIDIDIKELRKLEKTVSRNKSFTTPIFMSIEKQINILLGERIKMLELKIENPPESMVKDIEGDAPVAAPVLSPSAQKAKVAKQKPKKEKIARKGLEEDEIRMLTQDDIDSRFSALQKDKNAKNVMPSETDEESDEKKNDDTVKLLDVALERGTLGGNEEQKEKKVRFFRDNFPLD